MVDTFVFFTRRNTRPFCFFRAFILSVYWPFRLGNGINNRVNNISFNDTTEKLFSSFGEPNCFDGYFIHLVLRGAAKRSRSDTNWLQMMHTVRKELDYVCVVECFRLASSFVVGVAGSRWPGQITWTSFSIVPAKCLNFLTRRAKTAS